MINLKNLTAALFAVAMVTTAVAQNEPQVTTDTRFARGATMAFGRATIKQVNGNTVVKSGFCYSDVNKEPTIADNVSTAKLSNGGTIYWMQNLKPATMYYARAYAEAKDGTVGYGKVIKIVTIPKGTIGGSYGNEGDEAANARIQTAMNTCIEYWNNLTSIQGLWFSVHYNAGVPTAECSYGGWMSFGAGQQYQYIPTMMHEAFHAIGVGQHDMWYGSNSPLRGGSGTGRWLGDRVNQLFRFWDNKETHYATGDGTHIWCSDEAGAAVSYDFAANNIGNYNRDSELQIIGTSLLAQALGEDGLPPTWSQAFGIPYYSFDQEDNVKYYIKNESESYGLTSSFLVETADHKLQWKAMSAEEAKVNDAAAWYVTFTPENQYYQFRNAATGYYMTYKTNGTNGIVTEQHATPTSADNFHLMRSRCDVTTSAGSALTSERGYWIIHPDNGTLEPPILTAAYGGATSVTTRSFTNFGDKAQQCRWLILTEKQATDMGNSSLIAARDAYYKVRKFAETLISNPHIQIVKGADDELGNAFKTYDEMCEKAENVDEINTATAGITAAYKTFLKGVCVAYLDYPFDLTPLLKNPDLATDKSGWTETGGNSGTWNNQAVEFYQKNLNFNQSLTAMPLGTYEARVQAFQRPGSYTTAYNDYTAGTDNVDAKVYLNGATYGTKIKNLMADRSKTQISSGDKKMADGTYIANDMAGASAYFKKGYYDNATQYYYANDGTVKLGIYSNKNTNSSSWTIFTNFRLNYYGPLRMEEVKQCIADFNALKGDADRDGVITMADANAVVNYYLGLVTDGINVFAADMDGDGEITMADANAIVNLYLGAQ